MSLHHHCNLYVPFQVLLQEKSNNKLSPVLVDKRALDDQSSKQAFPASDWLPRDRHININSNHSPRAT